MYTCLIASRTLCWLPTSICSGYREIDESSTHDSASEQQSTVSHTWTCVFSRSNGNMMARTLMNTAGPTM